MLYVLTKKDNRAKIEIRKELYLTCESHMLTEKLWLHTKRRVKINRKNSIWRKEYKKGRSYQPTAFQYTTYRIKKNTKEKTKLCLHYTDSRTVDTQNSEDMDRGNRKNK